MEDLFDKFIHWIPFQSPYISFFSSFVLRLLKKYPNHWICNKNKEWSFLAEKSCIIIQDNDIIFETKSKLYSIRTARRLNQIISQLKYLNVNNIKLININKSKLLSFKKYTLIYILNIIIDTINFDDIFLIDFLDILLFRYESQWIVQMNTLYYVYELDVDPFSIIIFENKNNSNLGVKIFKNKNIISEYNYNNINFIIKRLNNIRKLYYMIPNKITLNNYYNKTFVYLLYRQFNKNASKKGFGLKWDYCNMYLDKNKAIHKAINSLDQYTRNVIIQTLPSIIIDVNLTEVIPLGDSIFFIESCFDNKYYRIENISGNIVRSLQTWDQLYKF